MTAVLLQMKLKPKPVEGQTVFVAGNGLRYAVVEYTGITAKIVATFYCEDHASRYAASMQQRVISSKWEVREIE